MVVGLKREGCGVEKNASEARGTGGGGRRGASAAEGRGRAARRAQGRGREAAEPPTHPASPMVLRCIVGE